MSTLPPTQDFSRLSSPPMSRFSWDSQNDSGPKSWVQCVKAGLQQFTSQPAERETSCAIQDLQFWTSSDVLSLEEVENYERYVSSNTSDNVHQFTATDKQNRLRPVYLSDQEVLKNEKVKRVMQRQDDGSLMLKKIEARNSPALLYPLLLLRSLFSCI